MSSTALHTLAAKADSSIKVVQKIMTVKSNTSSSTKALAKANRALKSLEDNAGLLLTHAEQKQEELEEEVALCQEDIKEVEREKVNYQNKKVKVQAEKQKLKEKCKDIRSAMREARSSQARTNKYMKSLYKDYVAPKSNYQVKAYQRQLQSKEYSLELLEEKMRSYSNSISNRTKKINHIRLQIRSMKNFIVVMKDAIKLWELLESAVADPSKSTNYLQKFVTLLEKERKIFMSDGTIVLAPFLKVWNETFINDWMFETPPRHPFPRQSHKRHIQSAHRPIYKPKKPSKPCDLNKRLPLWPSEPCDLNKRLPLW